MKYLWDASALVKRYCSEKGTAQVNHLFKSLDWSDFVISEVSILEVVSIFARKRNDQRISQDEFEQAMIEFGKEVASNAVMSKLSFSVQPLVQTTQLLMTHILNSVDAVLLRTAIELREAPLCIITTDLRLAQAARRENLPVINPEIEIGMS